ncbi:MAG TPA: hypothetical protein VM571_07280 [Noviherbaspirillum sp.]|nr:hypothetical protein [Noviherbaspirillum sp.]
MTTATAFGNPNTVWDDGNAKALAILHIGQSCHCAGESEESISPTVIFLTPKAVHISRS